MPIPKPATELSAIAQLADELFDVEQRLAASRLDIAREEAIRRAIREHYAQSPADQAFEIRGTKCVCVVGPKARAAIINIPKLLKLVGAKLFGAFATCTLAAIKEHAPQHEAAVVSQELRGSRSLKLFASRPFPG